MSAITLIKGDDTDWNGQQTFVININTTLDLSEGFSAVFTIGDITKEFDFIQDNKIYPILTNKETSTLPLGYINGVLKIYDAEKRIRTIKSNIPFNVRAGVYTSNADINADGETIPTEEIDVTISGAELVDYNALTNKPTLNGYELKGAVTLENIGLGNVDNTSDLDKPISTATQTALDLKADKTALQETDTRVEANSNDITNIKADVVDIETNKADKTDLESIDQSISTIGSTLTEHQGEIEKLGSTVTGLTITVNGKQDKGDYALKSEIPEKLANPNALTINYNGKQAFTYDGSAAETGNFIVNAETVPMSESDETTIKQALDKKADSTELTATIGEVESLETRVDTLETDIGDLGNAVALNTANISTKQDKLIAGSNIQISDNTISATDTVYTLPEASTTVLGGVKVDGTTITINDGVISSVGGETEGTTDYSVLTNKPQINSIELTGNKSLTDLGIQPAGTYLTEVPAEYVTETELNSKGYLTTVPAEYITETELNEKGYLTSVPSEYVTETELEDKGYITASALTGYAQTSDIPTSTSELTNDSGFITNAVDNLTNYTPTSSLSTVATSGSYNDLTNKPTIVTSYNDLTDKPDIPEAYTLPTASTTTLGGVKVDGTTVTIEDGVITAHVTSTGGTSDYTTLTNKPQIGGVELTGNKSLSDLGIQPAGEYLVEADLADYAKTSDIPTDYLTEADLTGYATTADLEGYVETGDLAGYAQTSSLSTVATSGSYNDLEDKPSIPEAYTLPTASTTVLGGVKVDGSTITIADGTITAHVTGESGTTDYSVLTNKPQINSVELSGNKTLSELGIQPAGDYATNTSLASKADVTDLDNYLTIDDAIGNYASKDDLSAKADATSVPSNVSDLTNDSGFITNTVDNLTNYTKTSELASVATSGSYNDLSDKPSIPSEYTLPIASDTTLGGVKVDGTTITATAEGVISAVGGGSTTPSNMATTDTVQTFTALKHFAAGIDLGLNQEFMVGNGTTVIMHNGSRLLIGATSDNLTIQSVSEVKINRGGQNYDNVDSGNVSTYLPITTTIDSASTDAQVPSAKAVYDILGNIETQLSQI